MVASLYKWLIVSLFASFTPAGSKSTETGKLYHPFFVCVTEVNHNNTDKTLEISAKLFVDDFEKVLTSKHKSVVSISSPKDKALLDAQISQYMKEHLSFKVDGRSVSYNYIGFEKEEDAVYCYLEVSNVPSLKKLDVTNSILHDLNSNQINILHVMVNGERKSQKLDFPKTETSFGF